MKKCRFVAGLMVAAMLVPFVPMKSRAYNVSLDDFKCIRRQVAEYDIDHDGYLSTEERKEIIELNLSNIDSIYNTEGNYALEEDLKNLGYLKQLYVSDCKNVTELNDIFTYNRNLEHVIANSSGLQSISLNGASSLKRLEIMNTNISELNLTFCNNLEILYCELTKINEFSVIPCPKLAEAAQGTKDTSDPEYDYYQSNAGAELSCNPGAIIHSEVPAGWIYLGKDNIPDYELRSYFTGIFSDYENDIQWNCIDPNIVTSVWCSSMTGGLQLFPNLKGIRFEGDVETSLDIKDLPKLERLRFCSYYDLTVTYSNLPNLTEIECDISNVTLPSGTIASQIKTLTLDRIDNAAPLDLSGYTNLEKLTITECSYTSINLGTNTKLKELKIVECPNIASVDISYNTGIESVWIHDLPKMNSLNIGWNDNLLSVYVDQVPAEHWYQYQASRYSPSWDVWTPTLLIDDRITVDTTKVPRPTPAPTPSTPSVPSTPSTPAGSTSEGGVAGFVERLYTVALGRASDATGKANWINAIRGGESGAEAAKGFLFSNEFLNKNMSNADFVTTLYRVFFDRQPDAAGHAAWVAALERGESKQDVIMGFINSTEWANVCVKYGIRSGGTGTANITIEPNESVVAFATRLYTTCLKRTPDQNGLRAWALQLANLRDTGTNAAHGFFFSDEMNRANISNEEFVTRLYLTFMDRQPDQAGFDAWVGQLNSGVSREEVFQGFAQSTEFGQICANYGIIR